MNKITILGGGGVRTPLLIYGLAQAGPALPIQEVSLFDQDGERTETIARLGREIVRQQQGSFEIRVEPHLEDAAAGADLVINSVRVGGILGRARDERLAIEHGLAGQETTGPGGAAMALRTLPVTLAHAAVVARVAPGAWFINFTNPAGLITEALTQNTGLRVIGICDTPSELFHRIAQAIGEPLEDFEFDYAGLNHLGWIRRVKLRGEDITDSILSNSALLRRFYPARLFDPELIQSLNLIPTEYLFFYYNGQLAYQNQLRAGASRGEELAQMNNGLFQQLRSGSPADALSAYRNYLNQRNASYLKLEAQAGSAFEAVENLEDPFDTATGYHRMALDVMTGLVSEQPREMVLNVPNHGGIEDLESLDVVEVPCDVDRHGAHPRRTGPLPAPVRGLVQSVKQYERTLIRAALSGSAALARLALLENPIVGEWELSLKLVQALRTADPDHLGYLR
jgi:6-phospho-beta-glucosidase